MIFSGTITPMPKPQTALAAGLLSVASLGLVASPASADAAEQPPGAATARSAAAPADLVDLGADPIDTVEGAGDSLTGALGI